MILIGRFNSPFVRRAAITLRLYGIEHEHQALGTASKELREANPLGRVPALITDDGEALIDSTTIIDYLDRLAGPEKALTPAGGAERTRMMSLVGLAVGAGEKAVAAYYELGQRPEEMQHRPWVEKCLGQSKDGFDALDREAVMPWLTGKRLTQADVSMVACWDFALRTWDPKTPPPQCPNIEAIAARANAMPEFAETIPTP